MSNERPHELFNTICTAAVHSSPPFHLLSWGLRTAAKAKGLPMWHEAPCNSNPTLEVMPQCRDKQAKQAKHEVGRR